jgi:hypothetical protein
MAALLVAPHGLAWAQEAGPARRVRLEDPQAPNKDRFGISYRGSYNMTAQFKNVGVKPPAAGSRGPGPARGGVDHFYDDGYVRVDSTHSGGGLTWFWGYKNASQVTGNDTLDMHSSSVTPISSKPEDDGAQPGFEISYNRELGRLEQRGWTWGLEGAFGWTDIDLKDTRPLAGGLRTITDSYNLGGINPNQPPYSTEYPGHAGTYEGPGPLIDDSPSRSMDFDAQGAQVTGWRRFEADLFTFRLGPYLDMPIDERWTFSLSAGLAMGYVDGQFRFVQQVSTSAGRSFQTGQGSNADFIFGGFAGATLRFAINENWSLFASGQYLGLTDYTAQAGGQEVELDFSRTASGLIGLTFSF